MVEWSGCLESERDPRRHPKWCRLITTRNSVFTGFNSSFLADIQGEIWWTWLFNLLICTSRSPTTVGSKNVINELPVIRKLVVVNTMAHQDFGWWYDVHYKKERSSYLLLLYSHCTTMLCIRQFVVSLRTWLVDISYADFSHFISFVNGQRPDQQCWSCALRRTLLYYIQFYSVTITLYIIMYSLPDQLCSLCLIVVPTVEERILSFDSKFAKWLNSCNNPR